MTRKLGVNTLCGLRGVFNNSKSRSFSSHKYQSDYVKTVLRKFLFYVHPDFLQQHKNEQKINDTNLKILHEVISATDPQASVYGMSHRSKSTREARTLIFYVKPTSDDRPRKVKVSMSRITESMRDILDTVGVELPPPPENENNSNTRSAFLTSNPAEVTKLLDSLLDRLERTQDFARLLDQARNQLGLDAIEFRFSWSSQNKMVLLNSILSAIDSNKEDFHLPWKGLSLVITHDDSHNHPVDPLEGCIYLNPADVPVNWISTFNEITSNVIHRANSMKADAVKHNKQVEFILTLLLREFLRRDHNMDYGDSSEPSPKTSSDFMTFLENIYNKTNRKSFRSASITSKDGRKPINEGIGDESDTFLSHVHVRIRKGFTCNSHAFAQFLSGHSGTLQSWMSSGLDESESSLQDTIPLEQTSAAVGTHPKHGLVFVTDESNNNDATSRAVRDHRSTHEPKSESRGDSSCFTESGLKIRDVIVNIVVEEGYGTKLLSSGDIRVDCRCSTEDLLKLLSVKATESTSLNLRREILREKVEDLSDGITKELGVYSIDAGVGVDLDMMESCLSRLEEFRTAHNKWGKFQSLAGTRLRIGRYLGIADDGSVILPWNWELTEPA